MDTSTPPRATRSLRIRLLAAAFAVAALTGGTNDTANADLELYLSRLARTLGAPPIPVTPPALAALPSPRDAHLELTSGNLDALDFLALSGCALQITIGKRNSSLGRLARDSQRLLLDLEYLELAPECIAQQRQRGATALADTLQQAWDMKRTQLPISIYNATLASAEYRELWSPPAYIDSAYPTNTSSAVITSLEAINGHVRRWLAGDFSAKNREFEILLGEAATGDGGTLATALAAQAGILATANRTLEQRMQRGPLCAPPIYPAESEILVNVVKKYFIQGIQPRAAALNRRYHDLLAPISALEQLLHTALPPAYQAWQQRRNEQLAEWTAAPRRHVNALQLIQQPCTPV